MSRIGHDCVQDARGSSNVTKPTSREGWAAGAVTGVVSRTLTQPFDVLKIRFQLQSESRAQAKYKSMGGATLAICKEEGARALWKGHVSGQYLSVILASIQFGLYQGLWQAAVGSGAVRVRSRAKAGALDVAFGAAAAVPATVASYPFDVVRTRMVGQGGPSSSPELTRAQYRSMTEAFVTMARVEGPSSFFKGLAPALYTVPLQAGLHLCFYNYLKPFIKPYITRVDGSNVPYQSQVATALLGGVSGVITKTLTFPLDTVKKRLQVQGFGEARRQLGSTPNYSGFVHCMGTVWRQEGLFTGLFKGWTPAAVKSFPSGAIQFYLLETTMYLLARLRKESS